MVKKIILIITLLFSLSLGFSAGTINDDGTFTITTANNFNVNGMLVSTTGDLDLTNNAITNLASINGVISSTELSFLNGVTSNIQTQIDSLSVTNCPVGYSCPTTYAELVTMGANSSINMIWLNSENTYTENGNDLILTSSSKIIKGNNATIVYDTTGCSGGNVQLDVDKNYKFYEIHFEGNGCNTDMLRGLSPTNGTGNLELYDVKLSNIGTNVKAIYWRGRYMTIQNSVFEKVCSGFSVDNSAGYSEYRVIDNVFTSNSACDRNENEALEFNHFNGTVIARGNTIGNPLNLSQGFHENAIDCGATRCEIDGNTIHGDPSNALTNSFLFADSQVTGQADMIVTDNRLFNICGNMRGLSIGNNNANNFSVVKVRGNSFYGCGDGINTNNVGIKVDGDFQKAILSENTFYDLYRGIRTAGTNISVVWNDFHNIVEKDWQDDAAAAVRATNVRMDRITTQTGTSGFICISAPVREWEIHYGATC